MNSMSPLPRSDSAPAPSMIVRLSTCDATRNAIRLGKFALISPVITFTLGRCVARMRWIPIARAFCASIAIGVSTSPCTVIIRSAISSMMMTMYGNAFPSYSPSSNAMSAAIGRLSAGPSPRFHLWKRRLKAWMFRQPFFASSS